MRCPMFDTVSATAGLIAYLDGYVAGIIGMARLSNVNLTALEGDAVYSQRFQSHVFLDRPKETGYFPGREIHRLDVMPRQHPSDAVVYRPDTYGRKATESGFSSGWATLGEGCGPCESAGRCSHSA
jgi:hypothetical protein